MIRDRLVLEMHQVNSPILVLRSGRHALSVAISLVVATAAAADDELFVYADRQAVPRTSSIARVEVLTSEDFARLPVRDIPEALITLPNVNVRRSGGMLAEPSIGLFGRSARARSSSSTTVAIDGVPLNNGIFPDASLNILPMLAVERLEVIQGPASALYGNNSRFGVVNLVPRLPAERVGIVELSATRWNTSGLGALVGGAGDALGGEHRAAMAVQRRSSDGHLQPGGRTDFSDSDLENVALFTSSDWGGTRLSLAALSYRWDRNNPSYLVQPGNPAATNPIGSPTARTEDGHRSHTHLKLERDLLEHWVGGISFTRHRYDENTLFNPNYAVPSGNGATDPTGNATTSQGVVATATRSGERVDLTLGAEVLSGVEENTLAGTEQTGRSRGLFAQARYRLLDDQLTLYGAYRVDDFNFYDASSRAPRAGFVFAPQERNWRVRASHARAFSAPSFSQLFGALGNRRLVASEFSVDEAAVEFTPASSFQWGVSVFQSEETDAIFPRPRNQNPICTPGPGNCFINAPDIVATEGAVVHWRHTPEGAFDWGASYTRLDPGTSTFATARDVLKIDGRWQRGAWLFAATLQHEAERYFQDNYLSPFPDFTVVNASATRPLSRVLRLAITADNLTDRRFATTQIVSTSPVFPALPIDNPGRNFTLALQANF